MFAERGKRGRHVMRVVEAEAEIGQETQSRFFGVESPEQIVEQTLVAYQTAIAASWVFPSNERQRGKPIARCA